MPKPCDQHTHFSSIVDYEKILEDIKETFCEGKYYSSLKFGIEIYK